MGILRFWNVYRRVNNGDWIYLDHFYWVHEAESCIDSHKIIDKTFTNKTIEYKSVYE